LALANVVTYLTDLPQSYGSVPASLEKVSPPAVGMSSIEGSRKLLGDISPPGMWPTPDGQDSPPPQEKFRRRSLLSGGDHPPPMDPWFTVMNCTQDGDDSFLRQGLGAASPLPVLPWTRIFNKLQKLGTALKMRSSGFQIRLSDYLGFKTGSLMQFDNFQQKNRAESPGRNLFQRDVFSPKLWRSSESEASGLSEAEQEVNGVENIKMPRRALLEGDISPPGLWPDSDDSVENIKIPRRALLQGDISPPGLWPDSDDDESELFKSSVFLRRRHLLNKGPRRSLLQGDISLPGLWPDSDDDNWDDRESAF
jgi:hypothetical protein